MTEITNNNFSEEAIYLTNHEDFEAVKTSTVEDKVDLTITEASIAETQIQMHLSNSARKYKNFAMTDLSHKPNTPNSFVTSLDTRITTPETATRENQQSVANKFFAKQQ